MDERIRGEEGEQRTSEWVLFLLERFLVRSFLPLARHGLRWWVSYKWEDRMSRGPQ